MQNLYSPVQIRSSPLPAQHDRSRLIAAAVSCFSLLAACSDPPGPAAPFPGPPDLPRWSTAPYVEWEGPAQTARPQRPIALFVDDSGGSLDQLAHHADVATFLNDRFHAVFLLPDRAPAGMWFLDRRGCLLSGPGQPATAADWITQANTAVLAGAGTEGWPGARGVGEDHPLSGRCRGD